MDRSRETEEVGAGGVAARPAPAPAPLVPGPSVRRPPVAAGLARAPTGHLVGLLGSAGLARLQRVPRDAADAAEAAGLAPGGPLARLRDELDDTLVDEDECLTLLGQLGDGEKVLVGRDSAMMAQMADAFDASEMGRAIEQVTLTVKWQIHWLRQASDLADYDAALLGRLVMHADAAAIDELIGWDDIRAAVAGAWDGDPLTIPAAADPVAVRRWLSTAGFMTWARRRSGEPALLQWIAAHDPAATLGALDAGGQLGALLDACTDQPATRPALKAMFTAATVADHRRRLYEIRFATRAPGAIDWIANGQALWDGQELATGTGGDRAAVTAAVAAGGPADVNAAIAADARSPLVALRDELDDTFVDEDLCLTLLGRLTDREALLLTRDATMMAQIASAFDGAEMGRALEHLGHLMAPADALGWIEQADVSGEVRAAVTNRVIASATAPELVALIASSNGLAALRAATGVRPTTLTALLADVAQRDLVVTTHAAFLDWVLSIDGEAAALIRLVSTSSPATFMTALLAAGRAPAIVAALPRGSAMPVAERMALRLLFLGTTDVPTKILMLNQRFNLARTGEDTAHAGAGTFDAPTLDRIWDVLERLPEQDVAGNDWLEALTRRTNPSAPTTQGVTGSNRVAIGFDQTRLGDAETGAFTDPADAMRGTNLFDTNLIHEMGHASDREHGWTRDGGPFDTEISLGAWANHHSDYSAIIDRLATDSSLATTFPIASELTDVKTALVAAMSAQTVNAEDGFRAQAGGSYGTARDPWKPLWLRAAALPIVAVVQLGEGPAPWNTPPPAIAGRIYHDTHYNYWASYEAATRAGGKLSRYQFRDKRDFFAETYATYYETAPADPGRLVRGWSVQVYEWFRDHVDAGQETRVRP